MSTRKKLVLLLALAAVVITRCRLHRRHAVRRERAALPASARLPARHDRRRPALRPVELASVGQRLRRVCAGHLQHGKRYRLALPSRLAPGGSLRRGLGEAAGDEHRPWVGALGRHVESSPGAGCSTARAWSSARPRTRATSRAAAPRANPGGSLGLAGSSHTTVPSTSSSSLPRAQAKASAPSCRRCSPGRPPPSSTTSRRSSGRSPPAGGASSRGAGGSSRPPATRVRFNPLLEVRRGDGEVRDVQNIADILVDPEGKSEKRDHWKTSALHAPRRRDPPRPLRREGQVAGRRGPRSSPIRSMPILDTFQRMLTHPAPAERAASRRRAVRPRDDGQVATTSSPGIVSTAKTCAEPVQRPAHRAKHQRLGLPHRGPDERGRAGQPLPGRPAVRHRSHPAARPADPEPDRQAPHREDGVR